MADPLDCPICLEPYDDEKRFPMILECGHTVCLECISILERCHLRCSGTIDKSNLRKNYTVIQVIDKNKSSQNTTSTTPTPQQQSLQQLTQLFQNLLSLSSLTIIRITHKTPTRILRCPNNHHCIQFKSCPSQCSLSCDVCSSRITGPHISCRICDYDSCCSGKIVGISFGMHECPEGHELGYNPTGNKRIQCDHCEGNMNGRKHWSCRTCDYDVCEECV